jgi:hypothetical protein
MFSPRYSDRAFPCRKLDGGVRTRPGPPLERTVIAERTRAGRQVARSRGVKFSRKPKLSPTQVAKASKLADHGEPADGASAQRNATAQPFKVPSVSSKYVFLFPLVETSSLRSQNCSEPFADQGS